MLADDAKRKYGADWEKMLATGWLDHITCGIINGELDIPESDLERAYRAVKGEKIHAGEWD